MLEQLRYLRHRNGPIGMWVVLVWRFGSRYGQRGLGRVVYQFLDLVIVRSWAGARIPAQVQMGERVGFVHDALGIVIHPSVTIGNDVSIYHQVTLGALSHRSAIGPRIGNGVNIGCGAKVLGDITIGDYVAIGANAVVLTDVPDGATAVGNPARIIDPKPGWARVPR